MTTQEDPVAAPGTVLGSVPQAGAVVPAGSDITIIVAKAVPGSPSPSHEPPEESLSPAAKPS
jgi:beta-lactam-binding protein with PASTA domain